MLSKVVKSHFELSSHGAARMYCLNTKSYTILNGEHIVSSDRIKEFKECRNDGENM